MEKFLFRILLSLILCVVIVGCGDSGNEKGGDSKSDSSSIFIDLNQTAKVSILEIFSHIDVVPLETTDNSVIKKVSKIVFDNGRFFILDDHQNAVFIFDSTGKFERKIQQIGSGPGEYSLLYDINYNKYSHNIEMLNPRGQLLAYKIDGEFVESLAIPLKSSERFAILSDDLILLYSLFEQKKLTFFSRKLDDIIKQEFKFSDIILRTPLISTGSSPFNQYGSITTFFQGYSNEVYTIDSTTIKKRFIWDFGEHDFHAVDLPVGESLEYYTSYLRTCEKAHSFNYYLENEHYILTRFIYNKLWHTLIYDKINEDFRIIKRFEENIVPPANPVFFDMGIIASIDPIQIQLLINETILNDENKKIFKNINPEDNPILIKYYFRR